MLRPDQVILFADDNSTAFERRIIDERRIEEVRLARVAADPAGAARGVAEGWARRFGRLLVHVDVDVLDYLDLPIAEETRRNVGLRFPARRHAAGTRGRTELGGLDDLRSQPGPRRAGRLHDAHIQRGLGRRPI